MSEPRSLFKNSRNFESPKPFGISEIKRKHKERVKSIQRNLLKARASHLSNFSQDMSGQKCRRFFSESPRLDATSGEPAARD